MGDVVNILRSGWHDEPRAASRRGKAEQQNGYEPSMQYIRCGLMCSLTGRWIVLPLWASRGWRSDMQTSSLTAETSESRV
eukprot:g10505.t1